MRYKVNTTKYYSSKRKTDSIDVYPLPDRLLNRILEAQQCKNKYYVTMLLMIAATVHDSLLKYGLFTAISVHFVPFSAFG